MTARSKMVSADLIEVSAARIQEAVDYITMTKATHVTFMVWNGICGGIDTASPPVASPPVASPPVASPSRPATKRAKPTRAEFADITQDRIMTIVTTHGPIRAVDIGDQLGLVRNDLPMRGRVSYVLGQLRRQGKLVSQSGSYTIKKPAIRRAQPASASAASESITRSAITEARVIEVLDQHGGTLTSQAISDAIGIPSKDLSVRGKVSQVLQLLKKKGTIGSTPSGSSNHSPLIYTKVGSVSHDVAS